MTNIMHSLQTKRVAEHQQVVDMERDANTIWWLATPTPSAQVWCDGVPAAFGKVRPKLRPDHVVVRKAMHEQHGVLWFAELSPGHIVQVNAVDLQRVGSRRDVLVH